METNPSSYKLADERLQISADGFDIRLDGERATHFAPVEESLLLGFAKSPDKLLSVWDISQDIWGTTSTKIASNVRVFISKLRRKLGPELGDKDAGVIRTLHSLGYLAVSSLDMDHLCRPEQLPISLADGRLRLNPDTRIVTADNRLIHLKPLGFNILNILASNPDQVVSGEDLHQEIWGGRTRYSSGNIKVHVHTLRQSLGSELGDVEHGVIRTIWTPRSMDKDYFYGLQAISSLEHPN